MSDREIILPKGSEATYTQLHFAPAVRMGDTLHCSGQTGSGADGKLPENPEEQFANAFENVEAVLSAAGASLSDIVELVTYHVGFNEHIASFMKVKDAFIKEPYPAWTAVGVSELAFGAVVEIKATARTRD